MTNDGRAMLGARPTGRIYLSVERGSKQRVHYKRHARSTVTRCGMQIGPTAVTETTDRPTDITCTTCHRCLRYDAGDHLVGWPPIHNHEWVASGDKDVCRGCGKLRPARLHK